MKRVVFTFNDDGSVEVDAQGFQGKGCKDASAPYEAVLGVEGERVLKPEFNAPTTSRPTTPQVRQS